MVESCSERHHIRSHEKGVAEVVLRACRERVTVTVWLDKDELRQIIIQC